jgi:poly(3-hydroxybutyrate) depolymerase
MDELLLPANLGLQLGQWADVLQVNIAEAEFDTIDGQERRQYMDSSGVVLIETILVDDMGHAIAIDPDGDPPCGSVAPYIVDADICAASWIGRWFGVVPSLEYQAGGDSSNSRKVLRNVAPIAPSTTR